MSVEVRAWPEPAAVHRNSGCRIRDYVWRGRRCVSLENEVLRIVLCPDKGCDILEFTHKPTDTELLHQAPAGLPGPFDPALTALPAGPFRDLFPGGWYLMLPNGPGPCHHGGADHGHHGEATFLAWDVCVQADQPERCVVDFSVRLRRTPVSVHRRITLERGSGCVSLREALTSEAGETLDLLWGHHPTFAAPLIEAGARIDLPQCRATTGELPPDSVLRPHASADWPMFPGSDGGTADLSQAPEEALRTHDFVRLDEFAAGWFAIRNPARAVGVAWRWDEALFPVLGYWRLWGGGAGYPWYSNRRVLALEPASALPSLAQAAASGQAIRLAPGQTINTRMEATLFIPAGRVEHVNWGGIVLSSESTAHAA